MTGITKDELMAISRESGLEFCEEESAHSVYVSLAQFANAILERAAKSAEDAICDCCWGDGATAAAEHIADEIRALKINTGD